MIATEPLVEIHVTVPRDLVLAGEWVPLSLTIRRPSSQASPVRIRNVSSTDRDVQIDLDLLDREMEVRPGEAYRLTVPIRVCRARVLGLGHLSLQVEDTATRYSDLVRLPPQALQFRPAIGK